MLRERIDLIFTPKVEEDPVNSCPGELFSKWILALRLNRLNSRADPCGVSHVPSSVEVALTLSQASVAYPRKRIGAGLVAVDDRQRILLVEPTYKEHWEIPGGLVEAGESPRNALGREVIEEFGFDVGIGRLLVID